MITRISSVIRPKGSDLIFDHPYNAEYSLACRVAISAPVRAQISQLSASLWAGRRAEVVEEGCDVAAEQVGLLGGWEVAAAGHGRPPADVVQAFGPLAGRRAIVDELVEDSYRGGHPNRVGQTQLGRQPPVVHVVPDRGGDRLGGPVQGHDGEQEVAGESGLDVPAGGGPASPFLQHPGSQASG